MWFNIVRSVYNTIIRSYLFNVFLFYTESLVLLAQILTAFPYSKSVSIKLEAEVNEDGKALLSDEAAWVHQRTLSLLLEVCKQTSGNVGTSKCTWVVEPQSCFFVHQQNLKDGFTFTHS